MAYQTGTATDHEDFYNKLFEFVTTNSDLVAAGQAWERVDTVGEEPPFVADTPANVGTEAEGVTGAVMLRGPGLAGQDEIFVSMGLYDDTAADVQMLRFMGHKGALSSNPAFTGHVDSGPQTGIPLWRQAMQYWIMANGRRIMGVVKCGSVYESFYLGLYLPYAGPAGNPYPLAIGGTTSLATGSVSVTSTSYRHRAFWDPCRTSFVAVSPAGAWCTFVNSDDRTYEYFNRSDSGYALWPYSAPADWRTVKYGNDLSVDDSPPMTTGKATYYLADTFIRSTGPLLGGGYMLTPIHLAGSAIDASSASETGVWGILDGVFQVPGRLNSAENIVQMGGTDHLVVQNVFRTENNHFAAFALE